MLPMIGHDRGEGMRVTGETRRLAWLWAHLRWNDRSPDVRVLQLGFAFLLYGAVALRLLDGEELGWRTWPVAGVALSTAIAVLVLVLPAARRPPALMAGCAIINIAVLGMFAADDDIGGMSPLVVLPALWLGLEFGLRGAAIAIGATLACVTIPGLLAHGFDHATVERLVTLPIVAGVGAGALTAGLSAARAAQARAEAREAELAAALRQVEQSERSARAVFDASSVALSLYDADGAPVLFNAPMADIFAVASAGGTLDPVPVFAEDGVTELPYAQTPTARAQQGEEFDDARVWVGPEVDNRRALSVSARRIESTQGAFLGTAVSYTDVTEYMRALAVKDEFVALVSHELRTPLTSIFGYVSILLDRPTLPPEVSRPLEIVHRNTVRLSNLVEQLLDQSQYYQGATTMRDGIADLAAIARHSVESLAPKAEAARVSIRTDLPDSLPILGDAERLAQVVDHLVSNAIKHTLGGGEVQVRLEAHDDAVRLQVIDHGIGIDPQDHQKIFTRFYRTRQADENAIQGIGLGLAMVKSIVEGHGGRIEVASSLGEGSVFSVLLRSTTLRAPS